MSGDNSGESLIKTPKQLIIVVVLSFLVPVLGAVLLAHLVVTGSKKIDQDQTPAQSDATAARIKPVAEVAVADSGAGTAKATRSGEEIVQQYCAACHVTGAAGAPKIGDSGSWAKRIGAGLDQMMKIAVAGKGAMPPRGGAADLSDQELAIAVVLMANKSGGKFKEPAAPAKGAAPAKAAAAADERSGEQVVQAACSKCHETGVNGAPKIGDKAAWSPRISKGVNAVTRSAIRGHGNMPARGGLADLTDKEVTSAIVYMFGRAGADSSAAKAAGK